LGIKGFTINADDQMKIDVICRLENHKINFQEGKMILGVSERTLRRYLKRYREVGISFVHHGNTGRRPANRTPENLKRQVQKFVQEKYYDLNMLHCLEKLKSDHDIEIKRETFRKWCHEIHCVKRAKRRRAKVKVRRERMSQAGLLIQMDGSLHRWFGNQFSCLVATIDDATSEIPYAEFFESESAVSCMKVLRQVVERKGRFSILYVDRAGVYGGIKRSGFSQVQRAMEELGTQTLYAQSPEAKGRIERLFHTFQDRLVPELRLNNVKTLAGANHYLHKVFLSKYYNPLYGKSAAEVPSAYRSVSVGTDLNEIFCFKELRTVSRDHTLSLNSDIYQIGGVLKHSIYKQKIEIRTYMDGSRKAFFAGKKISLIRMKDKIRLAGDHVKLRW
jgi:transposase